MNDYTTVRSYFPDNLYSCINGVLINNVTRLGIRLSWDAWSNANTACVDLLIFPHTEGIRENIRQTSGMLKWIRSTCWFTLYPTDQVQSSAKTYQPPRMSEKNLLIRMWVENSQCSICETLSRDNTVKERVPGCFHVLL